MNQAQRSDRTIIVDLTGMHHADQQDIASTLIGIAHVHNAPVRWGDNGVYLHVTPAMLQGSLAAVVRTQRTRFADERYIARE